MKKSDLPECPVATLLMLIGTKRFKELQRNVGCSQKVLTDNLRELESKGLVSRKVYPEVPPRVEYSMTKLGATLLPVLNAMAAWGNNYKKNLK